MSIQATRFINLPYVLEPRCNASSRTIKRLPAHGHKAEEHVSSLDSGIRITKKWCRVSYLPLSFSFSYQIFEQEAHYVCTLTAHVPYTRWRVITHIQCAFHAWHMPTYVAPCCRGASSVVSISVILRC